MRGKEREREREREKDSFEPTRSFIEHRQVGYDSETLLLKDLDD